MVLLSSFRSFNRPKKFFPSANDFRLSLQLLCPFHPAKQAVRFLSQELFRSQHRTQKVVLSGRDSLNSKSHKQ